MLAALRGIEETPIPERNHFIDRRKCTDCIPYLVAKFVTISGLKTSDGTQKRNSVSISVYFKNENQQELIAYRTLIEQLFFGAGCIELGDCGCFCIQGTMRATTDQVSGNLSRLLFSFEGVYKQLAESESL